MIHFDWGFVDAKEVKEKTLHPSKCNGMHSQVGDTVHEKCD